MFPLDDEGYYCADLSSHYIETWREMEKLVDEGLVRYIGLSNFNRTQGLNIVNLSSSKDPYFRLYSIVVTINTGVFESNFRKIIHLIYLHSIVAEILGIPDLKHRPAVLQNESHPHLQEKDMRDFCRINKIVFQVQQFIGFCVGKYQT